MGNERRSEKSYIVCMFTSSIVGVFLLILAIPILRSLAIRDTFDLQDADWTVSGLVCTFERVPYDIEYVQSYFNGTGGTYNYTWIFISLKNETIHLVTSSEWISSIQDIGLLRWKNGEMPVMSSTRLNNASRYIADVRVYSFWKFGVEDRIKVLDVAEIHETTLFEDFIIRDSQNIQAISTLLVCAILSLLVLPCVKAASCFF